MRDARLPLTPSLEILGYSRQGRPIELWQLTTGSPQLLLLGGVHGDEVEAYQLLDRWVATGVWANLQGKASLWVIPRVNPDGCWVGERVNANGVDLNRNMATRDWSAQILNPRYPPGSAANSEPETQILAACIERLAPHFILSLHACQQDACVNFNGPCRRAAEVMSTHNRLPVTDDIGYPTPGSLGTWAGWERGIPTITLEILRGTPPEQVWQEESLALLETLRFAAEQPTLG
ncbi:MAG: M14 family zinc carboxypeptidase [Cyanobacteriota bacterium]|nr:M14 family zinc carboxypeptidase [Cyanobacteriota bacterium]